MQASPLRMSFKCDQNISSFKKDETGFCAQCQKAVYDFTDLPAQEIHRMIREKGGSVCGRIYADQLGERPAERSFSFRLKVFAGACMALLILSANSSLAQSGDRIKTEQHPPSPAKDLQKDQVVHAPEERLKADLTPLKPVEKKRTRKKKFMHIGQYDFYIQARFPFISIHRQRRAFVGALF
jgi:hypothetical protein